MSTPLGRLRGLTTRGIKVFLGIPYAGPTSGEQRFRPPAPARPWAGTRDAAVFGPVAPQVDIRSGASGRWGELLDLIYPGFGSPFEGRPGGEDCLALNVWTPGLDDAKRPVMVWFHGGGFQHGSGSEMMFHGEQLAAREDIVLVTVNHRLGVLGYTALADLAGEDFGGSGLAGALDLVAALEWVRDSVQAFGGDPGNVTIFGQSGGGAKVATLMGMPRAAGLFHKAIIQAGPGLRAVDRERGARVAAELLAAFGLQPRQAARLRQIPLEQIISYPQALMRRHFAFNEGMAMAPVIDDDLLPGHPFDPVAAPWSAGVPLLIGCNADEAGMFLTEDETFRLDMGLDAVRVRLAATLGERAVPVLAAYQDLYPGFAPYRLLMRALSNAQIRTPSIRLAERKRAQDAPVFLYLFTYETPVLGGLVRSCHSSELPFVFSTVDRVPFAGDRPDRFEMAATMGRAWAAFARTGQPGGAGLPAWAPLDEGRQLTMTLDLAPELAEHPDADALAVVSDIPSPVFG